MFPTVIHLVHTLDPGGCERLVIEMCQEQRAEYDVHVVCLDRPGAWADDLRKTGVPVSCLWRVPGIDFGTAYKLSVACRSLGVDIVHAHQCTPWFYASIARALYPHFALLLHEHGRHDNESASIRRKVFNRLFSRKMTASVVAVSEQTKESLITFEGLCEDDIKVIHNGVTAEADLDTEERAQLRSEFGVRSRDFLIGSVGRIDGIKNFPLLIESVAELRQDNNQIRCMIVGDGPQYEALKELVASLGLSEAVILPGYRKNARALLQCFDVFVLPSFSEGISLALLEAQSHGIATIATAVGGNPEIVVNDKTGWLVPSNSREDMVDCLTRAVKNPGLTAEIAIAGRKRTNRHFSASSMHASIRNLYHEMQSPSTR